MTNDPHPAAAREREIRRGPAKESHAASRRGRRSVSPFAALVASVRVFMAEHGVEESEERIAAVLLDQFRRGHFSWRTI